MKKDKSLEDKYWDGKSSLEDERGLKNQQDKVYFNRLKEAKSEEMDWDFDDFVAKIEKQKDVIPMLRRPVYYRLWPYGAAVAALLLFGLFYISSPLPEKGNQDELVSKEAANDDTPSFIDHEPIQQDKTEGRQLANKATQKKKPLDHRPERNKPSAHAFDTDVVEEEDAYVFVNGKAIKNEDEAEEITLASLKLMASNLQESKEALAKMKYMRIEL